MNKNIDELIKSALEGHEMPYNANAWKAFERKLEVKKIPKKSNLWKWLTGTAALVAIIGGSLYVNSTQQAKSVEKTIPALHSNNKKTEIISPEVKGTEAKEQIAKKEIKNKKIS